VAAVVAAGRHLSKRFEGWIVAAPDRRKFAVRITSYPEVDISVPFDWSATAAEVTERAKPLKSFVRVLTRFLTRPGLRPFLRQSGVLTLAVRC